MPRTERLWPGYGEKASKIPEMLNPSTLIRENWTNTCQRERLEGLVPVGQYFRVVSRGSTSILVLYFVFTEDWYESTGIYEPIDELYK